MTNHWGVKPEVVRGPVQHTDIDGKRAEVWYIKCPKCKEVGMVDADQVHGRVSIHHLACGYHETHVLVEGGHGG